MSEKVEARGSVTVVTLTSAEAFAAKKGRQELKSDVFGRLYGALCAAMKQKRFKTNNVASGGRAAAHHYISAQADI